MSTLPPPATIAGKIRLAQSDAAKLNRHQYRPYALNWHTPYSDSQCEVCLAGAVIAQTLRIPRRIRAIPEHFSKEWSLALRILNHVRSGNYLRAWELQYGIDEHFPLTGLQEVPELESSNFIGWEHFDRHLESLSYIADRIEALETEYAEKLKQGEA